MKNYLLFLVCLLTIISLQTFAQPSLQWAENYNGPINGTDRITDADYDSGTGSIYVTGVSDSTAGYNYVTIKYSSAGQVIWRKRYTGPQNQDSPNAIKYDPVNNAVYVTGKSRNSNSNFDWLTIRYNAATGEEVWTVRRNGTKNGNDEAIDLAVDASGNIYVLGNLLENCSDVLWTKLIKYTPTGNVTWTKSWGDSWCGNDVTASKVAVNNDKVVVIYNELNASFYYSHATANYISNGNCTSSNGYECDDVNVGLNESTVGSFDIAFDASGYVYIAGGSAYDDEGWLGVKKLDFEVYPIETIWFNNYLSGVTGAFSCANSIIVNQNNSDIYVTGFVKNSSGNNDILNIKYNNAGDTIWTKKYNGAGNGDDKGISIAKDNLSNPNIFVTGYSTQTNGKKQITTIKYDNNGTQLWSFDYGCTANDNVPVSMFRDPNDILYIAGYNDCSNFNNDYLTLKYCTSPVLPGPISGNTTVCQSSSNTYSIGAVSGATNYTWTLPSGWSGSSTTTSITTTAGSEGGTISVTANNDCGSSSQRILAITVNIKPYTPSISLNGYVLHSNASSGNQWYNQSGFINGATNQDYTVTLNGDYYVIVTLLGCSSDTSNTINVVLTGIEVVDNDRTIKIYPNPASNELIIEIEGNNSIVYFDILNAIGQVIFKGNLVDKTTVQTSNFAPGVYLIKLENGKSFEFKKIIKE